MAEAANQATSPASTKIDLLPACDIQAGDGEQLACAEDSKILTSDENQRQKMQDIESVTALPTLTKSTGGAHNVNDMPSDPTVSHCVVFGVDKYGDRRGINRDI